MCLSSLSQQTPSQISAVLVQAVHSIQVVRDGVKMTKNLTRTKNWAELAQPKGHREATQQLVLADLI